MIETKVKETPNITSNWLLSTTMLSSENINLKFEVGSGKILHFLTNWDNWPTKEFSNKSTKVDLNKEKINKEKMTT